MADQRYLAHLQTPILKPYIPTAPDHQVRIVHICPWSLSVGGVQRWLSLWCFLIKKYALQWQTHIVFPGGQVRFPYYDASLYPVTGSRVSQVLSDIKPHIIVHHDGFDSYGRYMFHPQVWYVHNTTRLRSALPTWLEPDCIIVVSPLTKRHPSYNTHRVEHIPNWTLLDEFEPVQHQPEDHLCCGIVGRLYPDKVPWSFVETLSRTDTSPWKICFIGEGAPSPYHHRVKNKLRNCHWVQFYGDINPIGISKILRTLHCVLLPTDPSVDEGLTCALVEAGATSLPIVVRDAPSLRAAWQDVALYGLKDSELLAHLPNLVSPEVRNELGRKVRLHVEKYYGMQNFWRVHRLLASLLPTKVSILLPVWNVPRDILLRCWESILNQTLQEWELVLVDDGSTDEGCKEAIQVIARHPRVRVYRIPHSGISIALNTGLDKCRCELVARMDGDDVMLSNRLEKQVRYMEQNPDVDILGGWMMGIQSDRVRTRHPAVVTYSQQDIEHQKAGRVKAIAWKIDHPTVMFRKSKIIAVGGYHPEIKRGEDPDLWVRCFVAGCRIRNLQEPLVRYGKFQG